MSGPPRDAPGVTAPNRQRARTAPAKRPRGRPRDQILPAPLSFPAALLAPAAVSPPVSQPRRGGPAGGDTAHAGAIDAVLCLPNPDWLAHRLTVSGPMATLAALQNAAAGPGVVPWRSGLAEAAESWFNRMMAVPAQARGISVSGAHHLAEQLRDALAARRALPGDRAHVRACPLDLHALIPLPEALLERGPDDPRAIAWLWAHWGTTWPLRHVSVRPAGAAVRRRLQDGQGGVVFRFHSADWSPWPALPGLRARWPALRFSLRPDYGPGSAPGLRHYLEHSVPD